MVTLAIHPTPYREQFGHQEMMDGTISARMDDRCVGDLEELARASESARGQAMRGRIGGCGFAKNGGIEEHDPQIYSITTYGQDTIFYSENLASHNGMDVQMMMCADGHGRGGEIASRYVARRMARDLCRPGFLSELRAHVLSHGVAPVEMITRFFHRIDREYAGSGGCTTSVVLILTCVNEQRTFLLSMNVGDSPIWIVDTDYHRVYPFYTHHAWDSPTEYAVYLDRCRRLGVEPREVVIGRINCGSFVMRRMDGSATPYRIFKDGSAEIDHAEMDEFERAASHHGMRLGGSQTVRKRLEREWRHENWGSTPLIPPEESLLYHGVSATIHGIGGLQMTRSFGDYTHKMSSHVSCDPSIHLVEIKRPLTVMICSDGIDDAFWRHELLERCCTRLPASLQAIEIVSDAMERSHSFPLQPGQIHDDCSIIIAHIS